MQSNHHHLDNRMTTTATRPVRADEELTIHAPSLYDLVDAIDSEDAEEIADCLADAIEDLGLLREEFPADWEHISGCRTPEQVAHGHLAWLQQNR
jgi:hypothetical protein